MPAILKDWIDRDFVRGAPSSAASTASSNRSRCRERRPTPPHHPGGAEEAFADDDAEDTDGHGAMETFLFHIHRGTLEFCGYEVRPR